MKLDLHSPFHPSRLLPVILFAISATASFSCKEDPVTTTPISESFLYPFLPGRLSTYTAFNLDTLGQEKGNRFRSVLFVSGILTLDGKAALSLIDTVYTDTGSVKKIDTLFFSVEGGDLHQHGFIGLTPFKRASTGWKTLFRKNDGLAGEYTIIDATPDSAKITGRIFPKEDVLLGTLTVQAYKLEIRVTKASGYAASYYLYFSDGKGIVQIGLPVQTYIGSKKSEGYGRIWQTQNF